MKDPDTSKWKAQISVSLVPVNKWGDVIGDGSLSYTVKLEGDLSDIVARLERLKEKSSG